MSPSDVNNAIRQELKDVRDVWNDKEWFLLGSGSSTVTYTRASSTSVTINADVSTTYHVGRRIKITGTNTGTIYGKIATSSYSSPNTTVTFTFDSGTITKLEIFEDYAQAWIPTFLPQAHFSEIHIFDFFLFL